MFVQDAKTAVTDSALSNRSHENDPLSRRSNVNNTSLQSTSTHAQKYVRNSILLRFGDSDGAGSPSRVFILSTTQRDKVSRKNK